MKGRNKRGRRAQERDHKKKINIEGKVKKERREEKKEKRELKRECEEWK